ncbi:hypothetical protein A2U01_0039383, partial [Trifolium medium]|nr:hypothetical protein [Trifolium medium]
MRAGDICAMVQLKWFEWHSAQDCRSREHQMLNCSNHWQKPRLATIKGNVDLSFNR